MQALRVLLVQEEDGTYLAMAVDYSISTQGNTEDQALRRFFDHLIDRIFVTQQVGIADPFADIAHCDRERLRLWQSLEQRQDLVQRSQDWIAQGFETIKQFFLDLMIAAGRSPAV